MGILEKKPMLKMTCMKVTEELKRGEREYVTPSCKMMMIEESSFLAASPNKKPDPLGPPEGETDNPNYAKQSNASVWEE